MVTIETSHSDLDDSPTSTISMENLMPEEENMSSESKLKSYKTALNQTKMQLDRVEKKLSSGNYVKVDKEEKNILEMCEKYDQMKAKWKKAKEKKQKWREIYVRLKASNRAMKDEFKNKEETFHHEEHEKELKMQEMTNNFMQEKEKLTDELNTVKNELANLKEKHLKKQDKIKGMHEEITNNLKQKVEQLKVEKNSLVEASLKLELEVGKMENAVVSAKIKAANFRKINADMNRRMNEWEDENEQQKARLATTGTKIGNLRRYLSESRTESNNLRRVLFLRQQEFEQREQDTQILLHGLRQIVDSALRHELQLESEAADIVVLGVFGVHVPD